MGKGYEKAKNHGFQPDIYSIIFSITYLVLPYTLHLIYEFIFINILLQPTTNFKLRFNIKQI